MTHGLTLTVMLLSLPLICQKLGLLIRFAYCVELTGTLYFMNVDAKKAEALIASVFI